MVGDLEAVAQLGEHLGAHQLVHLVVLDQQDHAHHLRVLGLVGRRLARRCAGRRPSLRLVIRQSNSSDERTGLVRLAAKPRRWDSAAPSRSPEELSKNSVIVAVAGSAFKIVRQLDAVHAGHVEVDHAEVEAWPASAAAAASPSAS